jgi:hypothetical protein
LYWHDNDRVVCYLDLQNLENLNIKNGSGYFSWNGGMFNIELGKGKDLGNDNVFWYTGTHKHGTFFRDWHYLRG